MIGSPEKIKIEISYRMKMRSHISTFHNSHVQQPSLAAFGRYRPERLKIFNFGQKIAKFLTKSDKFWPSQNFPGIQNTIFSKNTIILVSMPKIMKICSGVWKIQVKMAQKCKCWPFFLLHLLPFIHRLTYIFYT